MRNLLVSGFAFLFVGCTYVTVTPYAPPSMGDAGPAGDGGVLPDPGPAVTLEALAFDDLTVLGGIPSQSLIGYVIENRTTRPIEAAGQTFSISPEDEEANALQTEYVFNGFELWSALDGQTLAGPLARVPVEEPDPGNSIYDELTEPFVVSPGERRIVFLRADVGAGFNASYFVRLGNGLGQLLPAIRYADTGEDIAEELIEGNERIFRRVNVISTESMPSDDIVLLTTFRPVFGIMMPNSFGTNVGQLCFRSFGGEVQLNAFDFNGANVGMLSAIRFYDEALAEHPATVAITPASSMVNVAFEETIVPGPERCFDLNALNASVPTLETFYATILNLWPNTVTGTVADGSVLHVVINSTGGSQLVLRQSAPVVERIPATTDEIVNGTPLALRSLELTAAYGRQFDLGSLTTRVTGMLPGHALSAFRVLVNGVEPPADSYRVYVTRTMTDLTTSAVTAPETGTFQFTVVFPAGLHVYMGSTITMIATPTGFNRGDTINVQRGDLWWMTVNSGALQPDGRIDFGDGVGPVVDSIVWADDMARGRWAGSSGVSSTPGHAEVFTAR